MRGCLRLTNLHHPQFILCACTTGYTPKIRPPTGRATLFIVCSACCTESVCLDLFLLDTYVQQCELPRYVLRSTLDTENSRHLPPRRQTMPRRKLRPTLVHSYGGQQTGKTLASARPCVESSSVLSRCCNKSFSVFVLSRKWREGRPTLDVETEIAMLFFSQPTSEQIDRCGSRVAGGAISAARIGFGGESPEREHTVAARSSSQGKRVAFMVVVPTATSCRELRSPKYGLLEERKDVLCYVMRCIRDGKLKGVSSGRNEPSLIILSTERRPTQFHQYHLHWVGFWPAVVCRKLGTTAAGSVPERQQPGREHPRANGGKLRVSAEVVSWGEPPHGHGPSLPEARARFARAQHREEQLARRGARGVSVSVGRRFLIDYIFFFAVFC